MMVVDRTFFQQGETIEEFIAGMGDLRQKFEQHMDEVEITLEFKEKIDHLPGEMNVLVIAEPWSGDVLYYLPALFKVSLTKEWEVRIFHRDQYPELILPYRKEGLYHSIPVVVFLSTDFNELGRWVERPEIAHKVIEEESLKLRRRLREEHKTEWTREALTEMLEAANG
jgi:hypothetical protein